MRPETVSNGFEYGKTQLFNLEL